MAYKRMSLFLTQSRDVYFNGDQLRVDNYPNTYVKVGDQWMREVRGITVTDFQMFSVSPGLCVQLNELIATIGLGAIPRREIYA